MIELLDHEFITICITIKILFSMAESLEQSLPDLKKENIYLWSFNVRRYDLLRKIPGLSKLKDLQAVKMD